MKLVIVLILLLVISIPILEGATLLLVRSVSNQEKRIISSEKLKSIVALSTYVILIAIISIILVGFLIITF